MIKATSVGATFYEEPTLARPTEAAPGQPPAEFVYDNGQIMLELLRRREEEEQRRSFVFGLRRLNVGPREDYVAATSR